MRSALFVAALTGLLSAAPARADVEVAPPPREVRADGSRDPAPRAASQENPAEVVERIIKNSKAVGDKLAMTDTGTETRFTQGTILKDIDSLVNQQDNPPPNGGGDSKDKNDQKNSDKSKDQKSDMNPMGGMQPMDGMQPMGGDQQANSGRKPRMGEKGGRPKEPHGGKQDPGMGMAKSNPMPGKNPVTPMPPKNPMAGTVAGNPMGKMVAKSSLPIDDDVVKEVWGHLPDKLRQQVTQYYQEQFMPRYSDLLKQYYSSLANTPGKSDEMRK